MCSMAGLSSILYLWFHFHAFSTRPNEHQYSQSLVLVWFALGPRTVCVRPVHGLCCKTL